MGIISGIFKAVAITVAVATVGPLVLLAIVGDHDGCCEEEI
mgnify:FL=1|jgi:hypothetical protein